MFSNEYRTKNRGVAILAKRSLKCSIINLMSNDESSCNIEIVSLLVQLRNLKSIIVSSVYRHPDYSCSTLNRDYEYLNSLLCSMQSFNLNFYLLGDFNLRDAYIQPLMISLDGMSLEQIIHEPTRKHKLLDLIIVNNPKSVISSNVFDASLGDHLLIECTINSLKPKPLKRVISFRRFHKLQTEQFLALLDPQTLLDNGCPYSQLDLLTSTVPLFMIPLIALLLLLKKQ
jgi:hypothetical protein